MPLLKDMATVVNGYGRVDAFGVARNLLFGGDERNRRPQNAPVSLSYIWGLENTAWLQWGANMNSVMERNIGQSLGVGAVFNPDTFASTSRLDNLNKLEHLAYKLSPPAWPTAVFGAVDEAKAARGRGVYDRMCANCHEKPFEVAANGLVSYQLFKLSEVGTSPLAAENFDQIVLVDGKELRFADAAFSILERLKKQDYAANNVSEQTQAEWEGRARRPAPRMRSTLADADKYPDSKGGRVYPAKPLAGIWATAPYLNNGSVANMWDLLTAPEARPAKFPLGSREYDTEKLGYSTTANPASPAPAWEFDTTRPSNSNRGHVYGTKLSDDDKWALIEFLKVSAARRHQEGSRAARLGYISGLSEPDLRGPPHSLFGITSPHMVTQYTTVLDRSRSGACSLPSSRSSWQPSRAATGWEPTGTASQAARRRRLSARWLAPCWASWHSCWRSRSGWRRRASIPGNNWCSRRPTRSGRPICGRRCSRRSATRFAPFSGPTWILAWKPSGPAGWRTKSSSRKTYRASCGRRRQRSRCSTPTRSSWACSSSRSMR